MSLGIQRNYTAQQNNKQAGFGGNKEIIRNMVRALDESHYLISGGEEPKQKLIGSISAHLDAAVNDGSFLSFIKNFRRHIDEKVTTFMGGSRDNYSLKDAVHNTDCFGANWGKYKQSEKVKNIGFDYFAETLKETVINSWLDVPGQKLNQFLDTLNPTRLK